MAALEVLEALETLGSATAMQIARHLGSTTSKVSRALGQLRSRDLVLLDDRGVWSLP